MRAPFLGGVAAFLVGGVSCLGILTITSRKLEELEKLQREAAENAGLIIGLKCLPAGAYEVMGTITYKSDGSNYGHIVRNVRTDRRHCVSHYRELPDMFVVDPNGGIYNGSRQGREEVPLRGVVS